MAQGDMLICDGFEIQFSDDERGLLDAAGVGSAGTVSYTNAQARTGDGSILFTRQTTLYGLAGVSYTLRTAVSAIVVGFGIRWAGKGSYYSGSTDDFFIINTDGSRLVLGVDPSSGKLELFSTSGYTVDGTQLDTGTAVLANDTWYYIEVFCYINGSGTVTVRVNGADDITYSGATNPGSATEIQRITLGNDYYHYAATGRGAGGTFYADDLTVIDEEGSTTSPSVWPDGAQCIIVHPNGAGNYDQWTKTGATTNADVDDVSTYTNSPDDDSTVLTHNTATERSSWTLESTGVVLGDVKGVQLVTYSKCNDFDTLAPFFRISSTDYDQADIAPSSEYGWNYVVATDSPATTSAWSVAEINSLEMGVKVT